jgi:hypothetical protein
MCLKSLLLWFLTFKIFEKKDVINLIFCVIINKNLIYNYKQHLQVFLQIEIDLSKYIFYSKILKKMRKFLQQINFEYTYSFLK